MVGMYTRVYASLHTLVGVPPVHASLCTPYVHPMVHRPRTAARHLFPFHCWLLGPAGL